MRNSRDEENTPPRLNELENPFLAVLDERTCAARERLRPSVRPIFYSEDGDRLRPLGTCMLMQIDGGRFAVTCAHVLDHLECSSLHIIGTVRKTPVQIVGSGLRAVTPAGGRRKDRLDVGVWPLSDRAVERLGKVGFLTEDDISLNRVNVEGRHYMAMGYPYSRNVRRIDRGKRTITPTVRVFSSPGVATQLIAESLNLSPEQHICIELNRHSLHADRTHANTFDPVGMSGGPLVDLGNYHNIETYDSSVRMGRIAGMLLERYWEHRVIVSLQIQHVINAVKQAKARLPGISK